MPPYITNMEAAIKFWNGYKDENGKWITGYSTLNAIGEEMFDKRLFKDAALTKRCVILRMDFMNGDMFIRSIRKPGSR